ncbi:MAG: PEP-CTERM sorting domain-containing protein [Isosphaeraceae bacterium]
MIHHAKILISMALILLGVGAELSAGEIHIRYGPDAPEKLAAANEVYYEGVLNLYHNHPAAFEHDHPFYVKMFDDPTMLDKLVRRWESHEQRFEYWHNCLWKVLDGYEVSQQGLTPPGQILPPPSGTSGVGAQGGGGSGNGGIGAQSVPEPSTIVLCLTGLLVGLGAWLSRWKARLT